MNLPNAALHAGYDATVFLMWFLCPDFYYFFLLPSLFAIPHSPLLCFSPVKVCDFNLCTAPEAFKMFKRSEPTQVPNSNAALSRSVCAVRLVVKLSLGETTRRTARTLSATVPC